MPSLHDHLVPARPTMARAPSTNSRVSWRHAGCEARRVMKTGPRGAILVALAMAVAAPGACGGVSEGSHGGSSGAADDDAGKGASSGDPMSGQPSGTHAARVPLNHRPDDVQCSAPAEPGDCAGPGPTPGGCTADSDCTTGTNGRCLHPPGGPAADCSCTYDTCQGDTDCPSGKTCACHGSPYTDSAGNACVSGNCRVDADCGGAYCSPSSQDQVCGDYLAGYFCHTAADLCIDDTDCPGVATNPGSPACAYSTTDSRWECVLRPVCL
jgi:hypothetical protein